MIEHEIYKHKRTGNLYKFICKSVLLNTAEEVVIYRAVSDRKIWVRHADNFKSKFTLEKDTTVQ